MMRKSWLNLIISVTDHLFQQPIPPFMNPLENASNNLQVLSCHKMKNENICSMMNVCNEKVVIQSHPSSGSIGSGTATLSDSGDESDDSDYGLYEDFEELPNTMPSSSSPSRVQSPIDLQQRRQVQQHLPQDLSRMIVYTVKNSHAHISCRSFDKTFEKPYLNIPVCISMTGVRIVQDSMGLHAEFHVKMTLGREDYVAWKTLDDFKEVANACLEFSSRKKKISWLSTFFPPVKKETKYRASRSMRLKTTLLAWENVIIVTSKRNWFGQLSVASLMAESNALEHFLESLLFEIPDVDILLEFLK